MSDSIPAESWPAAPRVRWRPAVIIASLGALSLGLIAADLESLRGTQGVGTIVAVGLTVIGLLVWFCFFSGLSTQQRLRGGAVLALAAAVVAAAVRIDGFDGAMLPLLAWRWKPTAEQQFATLQADILATAGDLTPTTPPVDLHSVTPHDYPGYLGADRLGVVRDVKLERDWAAQPPRELWRQPIGLGWSAFAIVGEFAVTQEQRGDNEVVVCYELATGRERWVHLDKSRFAEAMGGDGPRATPTIDQGRVYSLGATGILNCLDGADGKPIWSHNILSDAKAEIIQWAMSGSPLVAGANVVVCAGGSDGYSLLAYDRATGDMAWHAGSDPAAYASPQWARLAGEEVVLMYSATSLSAHDPATGEVRWRYEWRPQQAIKCAQPLVLADYGVPNAADRVLLSSGYTIGSMLLQISQDEGEPRFEELWSTRQLRAKFSNLVARGDYVYGLDENILTCLDLRDGSRQWKQGRYGYGQLLLVDELLLIQAESGEVALVEATPQGHRELGRFPALNGKTWNHPALAGRRLLVRNDREAACFELPVVE